jgi:hypothetical protein
MSARDRRRKKKYSDGFTPGTGKAMLQQLKVIAQDVRDNAPQPAPVPDIQYPRFKRERSVRIEREAVGPVITVSTSGSVFGGLSIYLASFDSTSEITENWQMNRLESVRVRFVPAAPNYIGVPGVDFGRIYTAIDYTDDSSPASIAEVEQYDTCLVRVTGQEFERVFTPAAQGVAIGSGGSRNYVLPKSSWMIPRGSSTDDIQYFGLRWAVTQVTGLDNGSALYTLSITGTFRCKYPK